MRFKGGIRRKIFLFISLAILSVSAIGFLPGYFSSFNLLKSVIGSDYEKIADALASNIQQRIDEEVSYLSGVMINSELKSALKESNARYQKMSPADIRNFMADMDKQWIGAGKDSPLVKRYLETNTSIELKNKCKENEQLAEIFLSDRFGGLVSASGKTSDFYQADEFWWQSAFAGGKGGIFVGDIEFDESSDTLAMTFALPVKDDDGSVIGIAKAVIDIQLLFSFLADFKFGQTGHAALVDQKGYVISHSGVKPLSKKILSDNDFNKLTQGKARSLTIDRWSVHPERTFSAFSEVKYPLFLERGVVWRIFITQDAKEAFWPLYRLTLRAAGLLVFMIILIPFLGFIFGGGFARPIEKLKEASDHIARGELDYPIRVKTGDELEELANSFRVMSLSIKERESQLISQKVYSQGIVASMADALIVVNPDATLKSVNRATLVLLGYKEDELVGQPLKKIFLQEEEEEEEIVLQRYFQKIIDKGAAYNIALTFLTKQGKAIPVNFSGAVMRQDGKIAGIVGVAKDMRQIIAIISDLEKKDRELEERSKNLILMQRAMLHMMDDLQEASRARAQFTSMVSHELRTPLAAIKEAISLVLDKIVGNISEEQRKYLDIAKNNVDRLDRLISGVLDFQTLESGKMEFKIKENDVNEIINGIQNTMMPLFKKKGLAFELQLRDDLPRAECDRDKIIQVLTNLVNNALKFTEKGGIIISTGKRDNFIQVAVKDTGSGIKEEDMPKLFRQFTQLQRKVGGTGLGLSICKQIIEAHKGKIWAESEFGKGAVFCFTLPIKERRA